MGCCGVLCGVLCARLAFQLVNACYVVLLHAPSQMVRGLQLIPGECGVFACMWADGWLLASPEAILRTAPEALTGYDAPAACNEWVSPFLRVAAECAARGVPLKMKALVCGCAVCLLLCFVRLWAVGWVSMS